MCENQFGLNSEFGEYDGSNDGYETFLSVIKENFRNEVRDKAKQTGVSLFTTDASGLWDDFIGSLPKEAQQHYNCRACRQFIENFGGLLAGRDIGDGTFYMDSPIWSEYQIPSFFKLAVRKLRDKVLNAKITGVFVGSQRQLGKDWTEGWQHISVVIPMNFVNPSRLKNAEQVMAEKKEDFKMLENALRAYSLATIKKAVTILEADAVARAEKTLGKAEWFMDLSKKVKATNNIQQANNLIWYAVANAPAGFPHIRSGVLGTLLDDIASGLNMNLVKSRFDEKMRADKYQRPQAAPKVGNINRGNQIIEKLGLERSLRRRYARVDELKLLWKPKHNYTQGNTGVTSGVFQNVAPRTQRFDSSRPNHSTHQVPEVTMTWEKFARTVLPKAEKIEYWARDVRGSYTGLITAEDASAPPILQWDSEEDRNPVSWYQYSQGSRPQDWNLLSDTYHEVVGVTYKPSMWNKDKAMTHQGKGVIFVLEGAKDRNHSQVSNCLFPEILRSDLHEIRATIEAYSKSERLTGHAESACGIHLQASGSGYWNAKVRVTTETGVTIYNLDRWD